MPPLIHLAVSWLATLAIGAMVPSHASTAWAVAAVAVIGSAVLGWVGAADDDVHHARRRIALASCTAAVSLAAWQHARESQRRTIVCRHALAERLNHGIAILAVFDERVGARRAAGPGARTVGRGRRTAAPPASVRGVASAEGALHVCRTDVVFRVDSGHAAAGVWVTLRGHAIETDRGLRVSGSLSPVWPTRRDWRRVARGRTGELIDRDFGANAPLVRALLIADQDGIAPSVRDTFADAGLVHMLSISGLHVAIIAGSLLTLAGALRASRRLAFLAALAVIGAYVAAIGAPPPAVRSAVMLAVVGLSEQLQRPTHPWTALALGAVIPTARADVVLDLGWQLSVSGMAALIAARALWRHLRALEMHRVALRWRAPLRWLRGLRGWRRGLARELLTGIVATAVTAPLIAWTFGRISLIAPLSNLAAGPLVAFIQPALFLAIVLGPWPLLAQTVAAATGPPLALLDVVARIAAGVPHAVAHVAPTAVGAISVGVASAAVVRATASHSMRRGLLIAATAMVIAIWAPWLTPASGELELHMLDVGQGDALAIRTPLGRWILVDAGRRWDGGDVGRRTVVPYVRRFGGDVAAFILSHAHDDHVGGAASVVTALRPARWWEPAYATPSLAYRSALVAVEQGAVAWRRVHPGDRWALDGVEVRVLAPDSLWTVRQSDANETSVVVRVSYGQVAFLLTGDAEVSEEAWMIEHVDPALLRADVLKLGHHGSKTSSSPAFLDRVQPRLGLISVGLGNTYGHPSPSTLAEFAAREVPILRTDQDQTVVLRTDGRRIRVRDGSSQWTLPAVVAR